MLQIVDCVAVWVEALRNDREVVLASVRENPWPVVYASEELRNDREFVLAALPRAF